MQKLRSTTQVWCPHRPHHTPRASPGAVTHWVFTISWPCCVSPHCRTVLFPTPEPAATARPPGNSLRLDSSKPFLVKSGCLWGLLTPQPPAGLLQPGCRRPAIQTDTPIGDGAPSPFSVDYRLPLTVHRSGCAVLRSCSLEKHLCNPPR